MSIRLPTIATPSITPRAASFARLCSLNAGIQLVWGAVLGVSLQARTLALVPHADAIARYSVLAAIGALVATIVQLVAGRSSDLERARRGDRTRYYLLGIGLAVPSLLGFFFAPSFVAFAVAFIALQCTINIASGPYQAIIPDYVAVPRRGAASAWMSAFQSLGNAIGLLVAGLVNDLRVVAAALVVPLVATMAVVLGETRTLARVDGTDDTSRSSVRSRALQPLLISRGLVNVGFFALLDYLLFFVRDSLRVGQKDVQMTTAFIFLTFTLSAIVGAILAAKPADRSDKRLVVSIAIGSIVVALIVLATATSLPIAYASAGVAGVAWGAFVTADWALATAVLPPRTMATAMGVWNIATTIPQVVAPLFIGPLVVHADALTAGSGPRIAIVAACVAFALGGAAVWRVPRV